MAAYSVDVDVIAGRCYVEAVADRTVASGRPPRPRWNVPPQHLVLLVASVGVNALRWSLLGHRGWQAFYQTPLDCISATSDHLSDSIRTDDRPSFVSSTMI